MPVVLPKRPRRSLPAHLSHPPSCWRSPSPARDGAGEASTTLGEVIVTAQKRSENLQDVPISLEGLGNESIEELNVQNFKTYVQFLPSVQTQQSMQTRRRLQPGLHARRRDRRRRPGDHLAAERRHVPGRAADHDDPGQPRHPLVRHRARRGARRPAGHAVRRELAGGHDPHHHEQAGSVRLRLRLLAGRQLRRRRRVRLRRRGLRQHPDGRDRGDPARGLGKARTGLDRQRGSDPRLPGEPGRSG